MWSRLVLLLAGAVTLLPAEPPRVLVVDVDRVIHPITVEVLRHATEQARQRGDALIVLRLNTPGGFADATRVCVETIVSSRVPVATWVGPSGGRAASAGFFLLEAGDFAAMAPATNTGAAHPVLIGGGIPDPVLAKKIENDTAASLRSLVARRGRNAELAEQAVRESRSFTDQEALKAGLVDATAISVEELIRQMDGKEIRRFDGSKQRVALTGSTVAVYEPTLREKAGMTLSDPNLALALIVLGALGLYVEFSSPGAIAPGVFGSIALLLGLWAFSLLPVTWTGVALLVLALALFVMEAKVASHGVLAAGGAFAMILGAMLLVDSPYPEVRIRLSTAVVLALPFAAITVFLVTLIVRARLRPAETGREGMLGLAGVALTDLAPEGRVRVRGEEWQARAAAPLGAGAVVRVTGMRGLELEVEPGKEGHHAD